MKNYEIKVFSKLADDGSVYWTAYYPSVPGCIGGGNTVKEAIDDAQETLKVYLKSLQENSIHNSHKRFEESEGKNIVNENAQIKDLENKYVFWDIDGTLAPYRFNNHLSDPNGTSNGMSLQEVEDGVFLTRKPSKHMQNVLNTCNAKENIVMGHCQVEKEIKDKQIWLDKYYPIIKERLLVFQDKSKADTILQYCKIHNIDLKDVVYVDDVLRFLREAERKGIKSYHISSFLDWEYQFDKLASLDF